MRGAAFWGRELSIYLGDTTIYSSPSMQTTHLERSAQREESTDQNTSRIVWGLDRPSHNVEDLATSSQDFFRFFPFVAFFLPLTAA